MAILRPKMHHCGPMQPKVDLREKNNPGLGGFDFLPRKADVDLCECTKRTTP